ncbi:MAG: hypothetical protein PHT95_01830 [Candidatus Omnitrophica bacterium]|nr:hypothetical protein [Candidatus Omnitrophota bacterium]MDD4013229.1 hypothetical protein [Candidatus Omnitrophota bacterium]
MPSEDIRKNVEELIISLGKVRQHVVMYGREHRITAESSELVFRLLEKVMEERDSVTIGIIGEEFAFEKEPFYETSQRLKEFIGRLKELGVKKITFLEGVTGKEMEVFSEVLVMKPGDVEKNGGVQAMMSSLGVEHIRTGEIGFSDSGGSGAFGGEDGAVESSYREGVEFLENSYRGIKGNKPIDADAARQIVSGMISQMLKNRDLILLLTSVRGKDENMFVHGMNVAVFTLVQAESMGLSKENMADIGMASMLHNIGRVVDPDPLEGESDASDEAIKKRAMNDVKGAKMLLETEGVSKLAAIVAFEQNINYDGTGGPERIYKTDLNLISMMIAISSYYDRMRRKPSYSLEGGPEKLYEQMMKMSGREFHPDLLNNFFTLVGIYPPGTLVELDTKEVALVVQASPMDKSRPQVEILYDRSGEKHPNPILVNLLEKDERGKFKWTIVKSLSPMDKFKLPEKYT